MSEGLNQAKPISSIENSQKPIDIGNFIDISKLNAADIEKYNKLLRDTNKPTQGIYAGLSFSEVVSQESNIGTITIEKLENLSKIYKSPEYGQWKDIFEKNAELAKVSPEQAKIEKNGWKQIPGMMDAYDEWLEELETEKTKTVIALDGSIGAKKETVIALDGSIGAKKETVIALDGSIGAKKETVIALDGSIGAKKETVIALDGSIGAKKETVITKKDEDRKNSERVMHISNEALKLLNAGAQSEINTLASEELNKIQSSEKNGKNTLDHGQIARQADGKIDTTQTLANIKASILVGNATKYSEQLTDPSQKEAFQKHINSLRPMIAGSFRGIDKLESSLKNDPALPSAVSERHQESAKTLLSGATEVQGRRYNNGTYVIDYKGKTGKDEQLILDNLGNVTRSRNGLELSINSLNQNLDTQKNQEIEKKNNILNTQKNIQVSNLFKAYGNLDQSNTRVNTETLSTEKNIPDLELPSSDDIESIMTLFFPKDKEKAQKLLSNLEKGHRNNLIQIQKKEGNSSISEVKKAEDIVGETIVGLQKTIESYEQINTNNQTFGQHIDQFENNTNTILNKLISLGYDKLGQENLDKLIRGLSERDNNRGKWESGSIDMANKTTRDAQLADLEGIANQFKKERKNDPNTKKDGNSFGNVFQDIASGIRGNESFRNLWNSPRGLAIWLKKQGSQENTDKLPSNKAESPSPTETPTENK